jgi:Domain of unknown function (DUF4340)
MKLQRTPLILLLIALGLGGFVYCSEFKQPPKPAETQTTAPIFDLKEADIRTLKIQSARQTVAFEKSTTPVTAPQKEAKAPKAVKNSQDGKAAKGPKVAKSSPLSAFWQITEPEKVPANDGQVAFLLNLLATAKSDRRLTVPVSRLAEFGLDQPTATITVQLTNQQTHQMRLGLPNFDRKLVYAQIDPPAETKPETKPDMKQEVTVLLVPFDFYSAIDRPLSDWKLVPDSPPPIATPASPEGEEPSPEAAPEVGTPTPERAPLPQPTPNSTSPASASPKPKPAVSPAPETR